MPPHIVNICYSLLHIGLGLFGFLGRYMERGDFQYTALIPSALGLLLLSMTGGIKNDNKLIAHLIVVLTLLWGGMITYVLFKNGLASNRVSIIFLTIALSSFVAMAIYVKGFIDKKKQKRATADQ